MALYICEVSVTLTVDATFPFAWLAAFVKYEKKRQEAKGPNADR